MRKKMRLNIIDVNKYVHYNRFISEYKYRRGGKILWCLYVKSNCIGFVIIFGKEERIKFEDIRDTFSDSVCRQYDEAKIYYDEKWVMIQSTDTAELDGYMKLLAIKRKSNRK